MNNMKPSAYMVNATVDLPTGGRTHIRIPALVATASDAKDDVEERLEARNVIVHELTPLYEISKSYRRLEWISCSYCKDNGHLQTNHPVEYSEEYPSFGYYECDGKSYLGVVDGQQVPRQISEKIRREKDEATSDS